MSPECAVSNSLKMINFKLNILKLNIFLKDTLQMHVRQSELSQIQLK